MPLAPIVLPANQPAARFYRGGERIAAYRGAITSEPNTPEDWIASTTTLFGDSTEGRTFIDSRALSDLIEADPQRWLGSAHAAAYGADTQLLVKLLDAGQRLPVHVHPDDAFAAAHLGHAHGKAEAWYILAPGEIYLGFRRDVGRDELAELVRVQNVESLRALLHTRWVETGDTVFVPAGVPHAIGEGVFLVEVQQPEDLSILLEWEGFEIDGRADGHLGLGFDRALDAVHRQTWTTADVDAKISRDSSRHSALVSAADPFFRIERTAAEGGARIAAGYGILVVLDGDGELHGPVGAVAVSRGTVVLIPHDSGEHALTGTTTGIVCRPPAT